MNTLTDNSYQTHSFRAMGSAINFWLEADEDDAAWAFKAAQTLFETVELIFSRFRPDSELIALNASAGRWVTVSPIMAEVLQIALALSEQTGGLFDPTILPALESAGYVCDFDQLRVSGTPGDWADKPQTGQWKSVRLDIGGLRVFLPEGVRLDFGGVVKGWTAEKAVLILGQVGPSLVDAGGDLSAGAAPSGQPGWPVSVAEPYTGPQDDPADLVVLWLHHGSLATSGIDWRRWQHRGRLAHHLIDPRTGHPAETDLVTASVLAAGAAQAEAWAKTALLIGRDRTLAEFTRQGIAAVLVGAGGQLTLTEPLKPYLAWSAQSHAA